MASTKREHTFGIAAFAALAGVTPRALRHYDRLGLLRPARSPTGYRCYRERDLETLEEIIALKFIGVPLREIAAIRRRSEGPFARVLGAQRGALESKRHVLSKAIEAITAAEKALDAGGGVEAAAIRRIIEVMHMEQNHEHLVETYGAMLKAKAAHLAAMSEPERTALRQEWAALIEEVKAALGEDPAGPNAQTLVKRWSALLQRLTGTDSKPVNGDGIPLPAAPELRDALWARRAEWLPQELAGKSDGGTNVNEALADVRARVMSFVGADVLEFINRARAARR